MVRTGRNDRLDFWTSGTRNSNQWQWFFAKNKTRANIDRSLIDQLDTASQDPSLYVTFDPTTHQRLAVSPSSSRYATLCKIPATRLPLNNQTRFVNRVSQLTAFHNQ